MKPRDYEFAVAEHYRALGYAVEVTPMSNDYGVDLVARKGAERLAVQAKMYGGQRPINRDMVMQLHGAKAYFDCTRAVIATDARVKPDAEEVARKLGVEVLRFAPREEVTASSLSQTANSTAIQFDDVWEQYIMPLKGLVLSSPDGHLENTIVEVDWAGITRITRNNRPSRIPIEIFRKTVQHILHHGCITRSLINEEYAKRASSGIVLILSHVPLFERTSNPIGLRLVAHENTASPATRSLTAGGQSS